MCFTHLLSKYDNIFSVLLGVIVTLVVTFTLRHFGRIRLDISTYRINYDKVDDALKIFLRAYFFNTADIPRVLKNIRAIIKIKPKGKKMYIPAEPAHIHLPPRAFKGQKLNFMLKDYHDALTYGAIVYLKANNLKLGSLKRKIGILKKGMKLN